MKMPVPVPDASCLAIAMLLPVLLPVNTDAQTTPVIPALKSGLRDDDPAIRNWAALGILVRGDRAIEATGTSVHEALDDPNPSVRVVANEILGTHGNHEECHQATES